MFQYENISNKYKDLVGKPDRKRTLGKASRRWEDNIKMYLQEVGCGGMDLIDVTQDRNRWRVLVSAVMNMRVPQNAGNFLTSWKPISFSKMTLLHGVIVLVIYGIKSWHFTPRKRTRINIIENKVMRIIYEKKRSIRELTNINIIRKVLLSCSVVTMRWSRYATVLRYIKSLWT